METWVSWAVFLAIAGAAYWYYNQNSSIVARGRPSSRATTTSSLKDAVQWSDTENKKKAAPKPAKAKAPRKSVKAAVQEVGREVSNKADALLSAASSTAGAEADDDLSPVASPTIATNNAPSGRDVSDMLGSRVAAPSVLSIKPSDKPSRPAKTQAPKTESAQETKKQRQNRKKVEEAKIAREQEEKQRQALLEKQRRTAREARGEAARNGLHQATAPTSNAWATVPSRGAVQPPVPASSGELLDTFDVASTASSSEAPTNGTAATPDSFTDLPSEEEQLRLAMAESAWTTVPKGGKKQRKTVNDELLEDGGNFGAVQAPAPVKPVRPTQAMKPENQKPSSRYQILSEPYTASKSDGDSDWPVV